MNTTLPRTWPSLSLAKNQSITTTKNYQRIAPMKDYDFPLEFDMASRTWRVRRITTADQERIPVVALLTGIVIFTSWIAGFVFLSAYF